MVHAEATSAKAKEELAMARAVRGDLELEQGNAKAAAGEFTKGRDIIDALQREDPNDPEIQWYLSNLDYRLGTARLALGDEAGAKASFAACLKTRALLAQMDPGNMLRKVELMLARARAGETSEALSLAAELRRKGSKHPGVLYAVAGGSALCGRTDDALAAVREAIARGFKDTVALQRGADLGALRTDSRFAAAIAELTQALSRR
jgi:predicted Zn-dependent protease